MKKLFILSIVISVFAFQFSYSESNDNTTDSNIYDDASTEFSKATTDYANDSSRIRFSTIYGWGNDNPVEGFNSTLEYVLYSYQPETLEYVNLEARVGWVVSKPDTFTGSLAYSPCREDIDIKIAKLKPSAEIGGAVDSSGKMGGFAGAGANVKKILCFDTQNLLENTIQGVINLFKVKK